MRNWRNRIFTNLQNIINDNSIDYAVDNTHKLVKDKTIFFQMLSNTEYANDLINNKENAQDINIQLEVYIKSLNDGYELSNKVVDAMKQMSFSKTYGIELMANIDTNYKRLVMRFSRIVGSGDTIEKVGV